LYQWQKQNGIQEKAFTVTVKHGTVVYRESRISFPEIRGEVFPGKEIKSGIDKLRFVSDKYLEAFTKRVEARPQLPERFCKRKGIEIIMESVFKYDDVHIFSR